MKKYFLLGLLLVAYTAQVNAQGCVPVRSTGLCTMEHPSAGNAQTHKWMVAASNRYFKSFRHYVGTEEQKQRVEEGSEVINHSYTLDLNVVHMLDSRWSVALNVPVVANGRSSLYEHGRTERHSTHSFGVGDIRLTAYRWLANADKKGNLQAGLGLKLPTGDYKYQDYFYNTGTNGSKLLGPVDQSIQLGDGGTGIITELNGFYNINPTVGLFTNLYYLVNPREHNGVSTARGGATAATALAYGSDVMSVPDQYMARVGANFSLKHFILLAGLRIDGVPAEDLVGGSYGFRRPGYIIAAEPGVTYKAKNFNTFLNVPVALQRNRTQSYADKRRTEITGVYAQGDAAFADYVVNLGISFNLK